MPGRVEVPMYQPLHAHFVGRSEPVSGSLATALTIQLRNRMIDSVRGNHVSNRNEAAPVAGTPFDVPPAAAADM
jgi:hypothetical protein